MKPSAVLLAALLAAKLSAPAWAGADITIALKPQARVSTGVVVLGDVATLQTSDLALMRQLVDLPIGHAPPPGQSVTIGRDALVPWIERHLRRAEPRLRWQGEAATEVITRSEGVTGDEIAATARGALSAWLAAAGGRPEVDLVVQPRDMAVPAGPVRLQARPLAAAPVRDRMLVWVDVHVAERFVRTVPVSFKVANWQTALVAAAPVPSTAHLSDAALAWREVDVAAAPGAMVSPPADLAAQRTRRPLPAGHVLTPRDLQAAPAVSRGQWAVLRTGSGPVALEARVEVLQDGRPGDRVRVRAPGGSDGTTGTSRSSGNNSLYARVVGEGQLEVVR